MDVEKVQSENQIFVKGLPTSPTKEHIAQFFGTAGLIKRIFIYKSKGEATVTYKDPNAAQSAIQWFDGKKFNGNTIKVSMSMIEVRKSTV